MTVPGSCRINE